MRIDEIARKARYASTYYQRHKAEIYIRQEPHKAAWRERNREYLNQKAKEYYQANKERIKQKYQDTKSKIES
jgi:hypothetical protein